GLALASAVTITFTTRETRDGTTPQVTSKSPDDADVNVAVNTKIAVNFSEAVDPATVNSVSFSVTTPGQVIDGSIATVGATTVFTPSTDLPASSVITATLS